jgi:TolA-binding protein
MTELCEIFSRCHKGLTGIGFHAVGLPTLWLLLNATVGANGQSLAGTASDWSSLTPPPSASDSNSAESDFDISNSADAGAGDFFTGTNSEGTNSFNAKLAEARYFQKTMLPERAEPILISLLAEDVPEQIQKKALLELGSVASDENDLPRAQTIYAQYLSKWADDPQVPEVFLRQGEIFRRMGLTDLALGKFYSVMASALTIKNDQLTYYQGLVLRTQVEIAETHYLMGHYVDAADFYNRLLQNPDPGLNRPQMMFRLVRSLTIIGHNDEAVSQAQDFLTRYPDAEEAPEVRYYMAQSLKALGQDDEALQQVLLCLKQQKAKSGNDADVWLYWQQRVGNELANQLYHQGDYVHALEIYADLAQLDASATWQIPVYYQMGLTYEKLEQPQKASDTYKQILAKEAEVGTNATPGMQAVFDMARWRIDFLKWQQNAQTVDQSLAAMAPASMTPSNSVTNFAQ